jgi:flagellar hook assembly protein FlgD
MNPQALKQPVHFFKPHTAVLWQGATGKRFYGSRRFVGTNPPTGSQLTYALQKPVKRVQLTVTDIEGKVVGQLKGSNKAGLHQINWNLRQRKSNGRVKSGTYLVTLNADGEKTSHPLTVIQDPVYPASTLTFDESERLRKLKKVTDD